MLSQKKSFTVFRDAPNKSGMKNWKNAKYFLYFLQRSEKQREVDLAKNKQETQDEDLDAIEPVVGEPKERRPKGRVKRKSQRR